MKILAIDPGSRVAGYAAVTVVDQEIHYLGSGVLEFSGELKFLDRVPVFYDQTKQFFKNFEFDILALETLINVKNINSLSKLSQARGALVSALAIKNKTIIQEFAPNLIKSSVSGFGHADKVSIEKSLKQIFKEDFNFKTNDESDALAIAYTCALSLKFTNKMDVLGKESL